MTTCHISRVPGGGLLDSLNACEKALREIAGLVGGGLVEDLIFTPHDIVSIVRMKLLERAGAHSSERTAMEVKSLGARARPTCWKCKGSGTLVAPHGNGGLYYPPCWACGGTGRAGDTIEKAIAECTIRESATGRRPVSECESPNTPEPAPIRNEHPAAWDLVIADMKQRDEMGASKYGTRLQPHNGRKALVDAYQEILDAAVYLRQRIYEEEGRWVCLRARTSTAVDSARVKLPPMSDADAPGGRAFCRRAKRPISRSIASCRNIGSVAESIG